MAETWTWIVPGGGGNFTMTEFVIGMEVTEGVTGRGVPPIRRVRHLVAGQPGSKLDDVKHDMRTLQVPVLLKAADELGRQGLIDEFAGLFDPARGIGTISLDNALNVTRLLNASYAGGLEVVEDASNRFPGCQAAVLTFEADDPYWYDTDAQTQSFGSTGTPSPWFSDPSKSILPVSLIASSLNGTSTFDVASSVEVWPVWTIDGPGNNLLLRSTVGDLVHDIRWAGSLLAGQQLVIDTRPGVKTVLANDGSNRFSGLTGWDLWPLRPGENTIEIEMSGATGDSLVTLTWVDRFLTA